MVKGTGKRWQAALLALMVLAPAAIALAQRPSPERIDELARRAMARFGTPGLAVGVVEDGRLVFARGYGVREIGRPDPVDPDTLFEIASLTKAFTATALAILVDEGRLRWDAQVIDHLPGFQMHDPWVTREITVRDLLTHRSGLGLGAGDLLFWPLARSTPEEIVAALRHLRPVTSFRTTYAYSNVMYVAAGEVVEAASGVPWADFVEERILRPLGMDACRALPDRLPDLANRAVPHMVVNGELRTTFFSGGGGAAAAGGINCNVTGLARWAAMHVARGALPGGGRLLSEATHAELWRPVTPMPVPRRDREHGRTHFAAYALGWRVKDFHGHLHVSHSGGLQGMTSYIALLPERGVAAIALCNLWSRAPHAVANEILDAYLNGTPEDWVEIYASEREDRAERARKEVAEAFARRNAASSPSLPLAVYAGTYRDPWYGNVYVEREGDGLAIRFGRSDLLAGPLEHFQYDTFVARWRDRSLMADAYVTFVLDAAGEVEAMRVRPVSPDTDFSYDFQDLDLRRVREE